MARATLRAGSLLPVGLLVDLSWHSWPSIMVRVRPPCTSSTTLTLVCLLQRSSLLSPSSPPLGATSIVPTQLLWLPSPKTRGFHQPILVADLQRSRPSSLRRAAVAATIHDSCQNARTPPKTRGGSPAQSSVLWLPPLKNPSHGYLSSTSLFDVSGSVSVTPSVVQYPCISG